MLLLKSNEIHTWILHFKLTQIGVTGSKRRKISSTWLCTDSWVENSNLDLDPHPHLQLHNKPHLGQSGTIQGDPGRARTLDCQWRYLRTFPRHNERSTAQKLSMDWQWDNFIAMVTLSSCFQQVKLQIVSSKGMQKQRLLPFSSPHVWRGSWTTHGVVLDPWGGWKSHL